MASRRKNGSAAEDKQDGIAEADRKRAKVPSKDDDVLVGPYADIDSLIPGNKGEGQPEKDHVAYSLNWRQDPSQSFSDWSIVIHDEDGTSTTYHVHKCILANKSDYFRNVFHSGVALAESSTATSKISLEGPAAEAFPSMLDYIYQVRKSVFTHNNAVPLRHLAQYFGIRNLFVDATLYIKEERLFMSSNEHQPLPSTLRTMFHQATFFNDEVLVASIVDKYACSLTDMEFNDLVSLSPALMVMVFNSSQRGCLLPSPTIAKLCNHYANENKLDWQTFKVLTDNKALPVIDEDAALGFLTHCMSLKNEAETASDVDSWKIVHDRCVSTCVTHWQRVLSNPLRSCDETQRQTRLLHRQLPPEMQILLLENALARSGSDMAKALKRIQEFGRRQDENATIDSQAHSDSDMLLHSDEEEDDDSDAVDPFRETERVLVRGAGLDAVNGVYERVETFRNAGKYQMIGIWEGQNYAFSMFRCPTSNNTRHWYISIVPLGVEPGTSSDIDFYSAPVSRTNPEYPPSRGWTKASEGHSPAPVITIRQYRTNVE